MSVINILTNNDFDYTAFRNSITTDIVNPTTEIKNLKDRIVITGDDGCKVELYGKNLSPRKFEGEVDSGAFFINGVLVAELSDLDIDISTKEWGVAVIVSGYAPVSAALGTLDVKGFRQQELTIFGADGDDTISGAGKEKNFLFGGDGDDVFSGGEGDTYFDGGKGFDVVSYFTLLSDKGFTASLADQTQNTRDAAGDEYNGVEDLIGGLYADKLIGDGKANRLDGSDGGDTLIGGAGRDTLDGGERDEGSFDFASYEGAFSQNDDFETGVTVSLIDKTVGTGDARGEVLIDIEGLIGTDFNDRLIGDGKTNTLIGGFGDDTLVGGRGVDVLFGESKGAFNASADTFLFNSFRDGADLIRDFDFSDVIGIDRDGFDLSKSFALDASTFIIGPSAKAQFEVPTFLFDTKNGNLSFDADGSGKGAAKLLAEITLDGPQQLFPGDIVLI